MGFRTVVITQHCKCSYQNDYLVVRGENLTNIHLSEISTLILETTAVSITAVLLSELIKWKINLIICDEKHNPTGELLPLYGNYKSPKRIQSQINWDKQTTEIAWTKIVYEKILNQSKLLKKYSKKEYMKLEKYLMELEIGDPTNREGHAAKVYFNALFGTEFSRKQDNDINAALDYGYSLILSTINKEVVCAGYLTQIGIFHRNEFNEFNLSCDIMEPLRIIIDDIVLQNMPIIFDLDTKHLLLNIFNQQVKYKGNKQYFTSALTLYTQNILKCLSNIEIDKFEFPEIIL